MNKYLVYGIVVILIGLGMVFVINEKDRQASLQKEQTENELKRRNQILEQGLRASEESRMVLGRSYDSLVRLTTNLSRLNKKQDSLLSKVKGRYNQRTVTELEAEMISRASK